MRKKYLKGLVAGVMVGAVVIPEVNTWAYSGYSEKELKRNFSEPYNPDKAVDYAKSYCGKNEGGLTQKDTIIIRFMRSLKKVMTVIVQILFHSA